MSASNKFGTFGGVFTPSILTILGVIMYLRLPWVVGEGGLFLTIGIILAAHLISATTGLSVSSIATDKKVEAGGAYYIVSRSMGLSIGGTLGIALFVGLSFSISLYIIGFSESLLDYFAFEKNIQTIRMCGTVTLLALTIITFISTSLAIKTQYLILVAIVLSLVSIFGGSWSTPPETPHLWASGDGEAATVLFGIFFPAVTGFTAGVNMSGDLKDPKRSIPVGTVASIVVGLVVYIALAIFLAYKVPAGALRDPQGPLLQMALSPRLVVAGIWGATLSSALGSILGAPRILQALSLDSITPRIFGVGHGPTNEPRYALFLAFAIGEAGILIGELDAIARIVSVFFLATYGFLNLSASFEMIASPDFRPDFKIPRWVPVLGAVTCAVLMIWLDLLAMFGAVVVMALLFVVIKRRELQLETGDALLGVWSTVVRQGLHRLASETHHQRNWRPNILMFTHVDTIGRLPLLEFAGSLVRQRAVVNELALTLDRADGGAYAVFEEREDDGSAVEQTERDLDGLVGFFTRTIPVADGELYSTLGAAVRFHGVSGLRHNTVMTDWHGHASDPASFASFLDLLEAEDLNVMCLAYEGELGFIEHKRIDLWWSPRAGSLPFNIALVRFITSADEWKRAEIRFFIIADDPSLVDTLHKSASQAIQEARITAIIKVVNNAVERKPDEDWVRQYSSNAALTVVGIPRDDLRASDVQRLEDLGRSIGALMLIRASSQFGSGFGVGASATLLREPTEETEAHRTRLVDLRLPDSPGLAIEAQRFGDLHTALAADAAESLVRPSCVARTSLLETIEADIELQYHDFQAVFQGAGAARRQRTFSRGAGSLLRKVGGVLAEFEAQEITRIQANAERGIERLIESVAELEATAPRRIEVTREVEDFDAHPDDEPHVRRFKTRRRLGARLRFRTPRYTIRPRALVRYYARRRTLEYTLEALGRSALHGAQLLDDLQQFLNVLKRSLDLLQRRFGAKTLEVEFVRTERVRLLEHLGKLRTAHLEESEHQLFGFVSDARDLQQAYADDLDRLDVGRLTRRTRKVRRKHRALPETLGDTPPRWAVTEGLLVRRAALAPLIAAVQSQLTAAVLRSRARVHAAVVQGVRMSCAELGNTVLAFQERVRSGEVADLELGAPAMAEGFDVGPVVESLRQALQVASAAVPETQVVLRESSIQALATDPFAEVETAEVGIRRQLQLLIDVELSGPIQEVLAEIPRAEQRVQTVMEDVVRLISFNVSELNAGGVTAPQDIQHILVPVVENGRGRIMAELVRLDELAVSVATRIDDHLERVLDLTDAFAILGSAEGFEAQGSRATGRPGRISRITERIRSEGGRALVTLAYRQSSGVLLARRMSEGSSTGGGVEGVLSLVDAHTPQAEVLESLPFYYRQLYLGQSGVHSAFWVGRDAELAELELAVARYARGFSGPIVVTGEQGSGKTALIEVAMERFASDRQVHRITPPPGGDASPKAFTQVLRRDLRLSGSPSNVLDALPDGSVVVLYDLELWWERCPGGTATLELLMELIASHSHRCLFVLEIGSSALRLLDQFIALRAEALTVVECGPMDAETLKDIVSLRHSSTGLAYRLDDKEEDELSEWAKAQLFNAHFRRSDGNISAALGSWIASIVSFDGSTLEVAHPTVLDDDAMGGIMPSGMAILVQLVLHKQVTIKRLTRITGEPAGELRTDLARLRRMGLVARQRRGIIELAPAARALVFRGLRTLRLLP